MSLLCTSADNFFFSSSLALFLTCVYNDNTTNARARHTRGNAITRCFSFEKKKKTDDKFFFYLKFSFVNYCFIFSLFLYVCLFCFSLSTRNKYNKVLRVYIIANKNATCFSCLFVWMLARKKKVSSGFFSIFIFFLYKSD